MFAELSEKMGEVATSPQPQKVAVAKVPTE
jgi:hypothetical protein